MRNVAKHYLVKTSCLGWFATEPGFYDAKKHGHKRHYTEAFAMRPEVYESLLALAAGDDQSAADTLQKAMEQNNTHDLALTIKRYAVGGLSELIHDDLDGKRHSFAIKGPMGKGLELKSGKSVIFTAGTGMLVFVDLIGHMILKKVAERGGPNLISKTELQVSLPEDFQLELHTSFYNEEEAIGLTLIRALEKMSEGSNSFVHVPRLNSVPE